MTTATPTRTQRKAVLLTPAEEAQVDRLTRDEKRGFGDLVRSSLRLGAYGMDPDARMFHALRASFGHVSGAAESAALLRAVAESGTGDTAGIFPVPMVPGLVSFVDARRPGICAAFNGAGPRDMPFAGKTFRRPRVTTFPTSGTQVEKAQPTSITETIAADDIPKTTHGDEVNVTEQDLDWSDETALAGFTETRAEAYAIETESTYCTAIANAVTTNTTTADVTDASDIIGTGLPAAQAALIATAGVPGDVIYCGKDAFTIFSGAPATVFGPLVPSLVYSPGFASDFLAVGVSRLMEVFEAVHGIVMVRQPANLEQQWAYRGYLATNVYAQGLCGLVAA